MTPIVLTRAEAERLLVAIKTGQEHLDDLKARVVALTAENERMLDAVRGAYRHIERHCNGTGRNATLTLCDIADALRSTFKFIK